MARNIDTALLRAFVAVAETSGMTTAASRLNVTQAAVSQQIKRLEDAFGTALFERERRGLRLTGAGERLFGKAKRLLAVNDEIWAEMTTPVYTGEVRLGVPYDIVSSYLPPILRAFAETYPRIRISLDCQPSAFLLDGLKSGSLDVAVTTELGCGLDGERLVTDRLVWAGAKGGAAHLQRPLPLALGNESCAFRPPVLKALTEAGIDWRPVSEISGMDAMNVTVQTGLAVGALLASTVPADLEILGPMSGLPLLPPFSINLYCPTSGATPIAVELARHIREGFMSRARHAA